MPDTVLLLYDPLMTQHDPGLGHPETPGRLRVIRQDLTADPVPGTVWESPPSLDPSALARVHDPRYVDWLLAQSGHSGYLEGDPDTAISEHSIDAALLAAGAAVRGVEAVWNRDPARAFAFVRPPGHHAERTRSRGFCLFNNTALAAIHARDVLGAERILIVDWDVHHGNGTQNAFYADNRVLVFSVHRYPFFPGTGPLEESGVDAGKGYNVNVPIPPAMGDGKHLRIFNEILLPVAEAFDPQLVLVSAGFDSHQEDPIGGMRMTAEGYGALAGIVRGIADRHAGGRLFALLEGGYDYTGLARSVRYCVSIMAGDAPPIPKILPDRSGYDIQPAREYHRRWWKRHSVKPPPRQHGPS